MGSVSATSKDPKYLIVSLKKLTNVDYEYLKFTLLAGHYLLATLACVPIVPDRSEHGRFGTATGMGNLYPGLM